MSSPQEVNPFRKVSPSLVRFLVLLWLCSAALIAYIQRNSIGVAEQDIRKEFDIDEKAMGAIMSAFFLTYAVLQVPTGWVSNTWGSRKALTFFSLLGAAMTFLSSVGGQASLVVGRLGMGAAQAGLFPACTLTITKWMPRTQRALASGALGAAMSVGGAVAAALTGTLLGMGVDWKPLFALFAIPGLLWAVVFFLWFRDHPKDHSWVNEAELNLLPQEERNTPLPRLSTPWFALFSSWALWCIAGQQFFRAAGYNFYATWFATYLREAREVNIKEAGFLTSLPVWGVVLGSLVGGGLSDWLVSRLRSRRIGRQWFSAFSQFACAGMILLAWPVQNVWLAVSLITIGSLVTSLAAPCAYAITIDMGGRHVAIVFSLMNMAGNIGALLFPYFIGWMKNTTGSWELMLPIFALIYICAGLFWIPFNSDGVIAPTDEG